MRLAPLLTVTAPVPGMPTAPPAELPPSIAPLLTVTGPVPVAEFCEPATVEYFRPLAAYRAPPSMIVPPVYVFDVPATPELVWARPSVSEPMLVETRCKAMLPFEALIWLVMPPISLPITASKVAALPTVSLTVSVLVAPELVPSA